MWPWSVPHLGVRGPKSYFRADAKNITRRLNQKYPAENIKIKYESRLVYACTINQPDTRHTCWKTAQYAVRCRYVVDVEPAVEV